MEACKGRLNCRVFAFKPLGEFLSMETTDFTSGIGPVGEVGPTFQTLDAGGNDDA